MMLLDTLGKGVTTRQKTSLFTTFDSEEWQGREWSDHQFRITCYSLILPLFYVLASFRHPDLNAEKKFDLSTEMT